jgi:hypothetical protein
VRVDGLPGLNDHTMFIQVVMPMIQKDDARRKSTLIYDVDIDGLAAVIGGRPGAARGWNKATDLGVIALARVNTSC